MNRPPSPRLQRDSPESFRGWRTDYVRIDEKGDLSINEFRARARQAIIKDKCELLMIDYLQRMKVSSKRAQGHRELEINEIAQGISATAKELNVPIVVLAQLNRKPEERTDGKPELGDLRESGSIEQEARFVGLIWRPKYYATNNTKRTKMMQALKIEDDEEFDQYVECIVAKQTKARLGRYRSDSSRSMRDLSRRTRIGRSFPIARRHLAQLIGELETHGTALVASSQGIDTSDTNPAGRLQMHVLAAVAEFERSVIVERINAGLAAARERGAKLGRPRTLDRHVSSVAKLVKQGMPGRKIATKLNIPAGSVFAILRRAKGHVSK